MRDIAANNVIIHVRVGGQGPALVLVHGTTADHSRWETVLPLLEPEAQLTVSRGPQGRPEQPVSVR